MAPVLSAGDVHVWGASVAEAPAEALADRLSADEHVRASRFHFERDQRAFVSTRGILRGLLGRYLVEDPSRIVFAYRSRGKPYLPSEAGGGGLRFNVSHSGGLALFAFARDRELGVDVERERFIAEGDSIAARYFSPGEVAALGRLPVSERSRAFFRCWTRKEAFIKATGDGLSRPLDTFDVSLAPEEPARLLRLEGEPEEVGRWWIEGLEPGEAFAGALAVAGRPLRLECWKWDLSLERSHGQRREGRRQGLQGGREPRRAVFDLAR
jgi:4'-phosphopantetheinyl transferase